MVNFKRSAVSAYKHVTLAFSYVHSESKQKTIVPVAQQCIKYGCSFVWYETSALENMLIFAMISSDFFHDESPDAHESAYQFLLSDLRTLQNDARIINFTSFCNW